MNKVLTIVAAYLLAAAVYYTFSIWRQSHGIRLARTEESFSMLFVPALLLFMTLFIPFFNVYFWLYPERHKNVVDLEGSEEEKAELEAVREYRKSVGVRARLAEKLGWRPYDLPEELRHSGDHDVTAEQDKE
ncbi:MAG: hypothetical protein EOM20_14740 [Spartobacteria bacterium]|nr:hypothetical protein [Spartobacteria bacterium]